MNNGKRHIGYEPPYPMGTSDPDPEPRQEEEEEQQILILKSPDGTEEEIPVPKKLWDEFEAVAKERGVPEDKLFRAALDNFLKSEGY